MPRLAISLAAVLSSAVSPAGAFAQSTHQHDLPIDKQEKFVDLDGLQTETHTMNCSTGQIALNGSVKVDAVDSPGHPQFVDTVVSRGFGARSWRFVVRNGNQAGRAQLKLFIVCMGATAGPHGVVLSSPGTDPATVVAEDSAAFDAAGSIATGEDNERNPSCPGAPPASGPDPTMFPVRPGFAFDPSAGQMEGSEPSVFAFSGTGSPFGLLARGWSFRFDTGGDDIALNAIASIRCLGTHTGTSSGHQHAYDVSYQRLPYNVGVPPRTRAYDITVGCPKRNGAFGIIGAHSEFGAGRVTGSEPRGDVWAFRLSNRGSSTALFQLGVICLEKRVWHSDGSFPAPAPTPQTIETADTTKEVSVAGAVSPAAAKTFDVRCANRSHYVLSGTASIDSVSAGDIGVFEFISVTESRATGLGSWRFRIDNDSIGRAALSLRLVCVAPWTEGHALALSGVAEGRLQSGRAACGNGQFPVRAGYAGREPSLSAPLLRGGKLRPSWRFVFAGGKADVSVNCLYERTTIRGTHYHRVFASFKEKDVKVPAGQGKVVTVKCPAGRRAIAGSVDARRTRVRTVESHSIGRSWTYTLVSLTKAEGVTVGATCLGAKTTGEIFE